LSAISKRHLLRKFAAKGLKSDAIDKPATIKYLFKKRKTLNYVCIKASWSSDGERRINLPLHFTVTTHREVLFGDLSSEAPEEWME
jgi:hypothetical protein